MNSDPNTNSSPVSPEIPRWIPELTAALEAATHNIRKQLGNVDDLAQEIFLLGDGLQRAALDGVFDVFRADTWSPDKLAQLSASAVKESLHIARLFTPGEEGYLSWMEFSNKLQVFLLVSNASSILGLPADDSQDLPSLIDRAYRLEPFAALWGVEGLGHYYAERSWKPDGPPQRLLAADQARVPEKSLLMLHAGMGLSFASRLLRDLDTQSPPAQAREAIQRFVRLCMDNSRAGFSGAALESLGLVTRVFYPEMVRKVSQALEETSPELLGFFWHGAGRALYFSPAHFLPILGTPWTLIESEGATEFERLNLMAGLAWAFTLVNMRHPAIVEAALRCHIHQSDFKAGFRDGVRSSLIVRWNTTPDATFADHFCGLPPRGCAETAAVLWDNLIAPACQRARSSYPRLRSAGLLGEVFRFSDEQGLQHEAST